MATQRALLPLYRLRFNLLYQFGFLAINASEWLPYEAMDKQGHPAVEPTALLAKLPTFSTADELVLLDIEVPMVGATDAADATHPAEGAAADYYPHLSAAAAAALQTLARELSRPAAATPADAVRLSIEQVRRLYPLTEQAGQLLASRLDTRIRRQPAVFAPVVEQADARLLAEETRLGCEALFAIAGLPVEPASADLLTDIASAVAVRLGQRQVQPADSFWIHLITYDRYEPFPRDDYGYLYDLCVVFSRSMSAAGGKVVPTNDYENTRFYRELQANRGQTAIRKVTTLLLQADWAEALRQKLTDATGLRRFLVAFLFLKFRQDFAADDYQFKERLLEQVRQTATVYPPETAVALQLLGGFLTFDKLAPAYYGAVRLPLFQERGQRLVPVAVAKPELQRQLAATTEVQQVQAAPEAGSSEPTGGLLELAVDAPAQEIVWNNPGSKSELRTAVTTESSAATSAVEMPTTAEEAVEPLPQAETAKSPKRRQPASKAKEPVADADKPTAKSKAPSSRARQTQHKAMLAQIGISGLGEAPPAE